MQQTLLLHEMSLVVGKVQGRKVPMEEAAKWSMHQWISQHFQVSCSPEPHCLARYLGSLKLSKLSRGTSLTPS